ncbi:hypothetical protein BsWGS_22600 [Bradybaena similaris]
MAMLLQAFLLFVAVHAAGGDECKRGTWNTWNYCEWGCCPSEDSGCCPQPYTYTYTYSFYNTARFISLVTSSCILGLCLLIILVVFCVRRRQRTLVQNAGPSFQPQIYTVTTATNAKNIHRAVIV